MVLAWVDFVGGEVGFVWGCTCMVSDVDSFDDAVVVAIGVVG